MTMYDRAYYVGEGPENDKWRTKAIERADAVWKARKALIEKYGAKTMMVQGKFVWGLVWDERQEEKWKHFMCEQDGLYCYNGNERYKLGKQLNNDLDDSTVTDHTSEWLIKVLGVEHDVFFDRGIAHTAVGWNHESILLSIPIGEKPLPAIPAWFREVTSTEWHKLNTEEEHHA